MIKTKVEGPKNSMTEFHPFRAGFFRSRGVGCSLAGGLVESGYRGRQWGWGGVYDTYCHN